jgi:hypothetical protein
VTTTRWYLGLGTFCALVAGSIVAGFVLAFSGSSQAAPTKSQYFGRVAAICRRYGPRLDKVPPPYDIAIPGVVASSVEKALPILEAETRAVRALRPPEGLKSRIARWLVLNDRANAKLAEALRQARLPNLGAMGIAYVAFLRQGAEAEHLGRAIGFPRPPC